VSELPRCTFFGGGLREPASWFTSRQGCGHLIDIVGAFALTPVAATPLPPTWTLMILGLCGLDFFAARGTKKHSAALEAT
jgi:hypothetical protein